MRVSALRPPSYSDELSSVTGIEDAAGNRWIVTCPHEEVSGPALEATSGILDRLGQAYEHDYIPFDVPRLAGQPKSAAARASTCTATRADTRPRPRNSIPTCSCPPHSASPRRPSQPARDRVLRDRACRPTRRSNAATATSPSSTRPPASHDPTLAVEPLGSSPRRRLPVAIPSAPIHGDIQERSLSVNRGSVVAIGGWTSAHVGDPALDIAWIQATASDAFLERFCETYGHERRAIDLHVFTRAQLLSEIALIRWLVHGLHAEDQTIVDDARAMLTDLADDLNGEPLLPSHAAAMGSASINEAFRDWVTNVETTNYIFGTAAGPHPFPRARARSTARYRRRGACAAARDGRTPARRRRGVRGRRIERDRFLHCVHRRSERRAAGL